MTATEKQFTTCRYYISRSDCIDSCFLLRRYFYIYTLGNDDPINNKETGYAYEAMLENMPQVVRVQSKSAKVGNVGKQANFLAHTSRLPHD